MTKNRRKEIIEWIWYLVMVFIVIGILVITALYGKLGPSDQDQEYVTITNEMTISENQVTTDIFNYDTPGKCEAIDARAKIIVTKMNISGNLTVKINDILLGDNLRIAFPGLYSLGCECDCNILTCNCFVLIGENKVEIISHGFEGKLKYEIIVQE